MSSERTVGDAAAALERRFPAAWAEEWDNVGLVLGDAASYLTGIRISLNATAEAVTRCAEGGMNLLVTHHPPFLEPAGVPERAAGPAGAIEASIRLGVAVISLHTNLDRSPEGATALACALGLTPASPLESAAEPIVLVVTYAPAEAIDSLREAMTDAGAGRLGSYEACAFTSMGVGHFRSLEGAHPVMDDPGVGVDEVRLEMIAPRHLAPAVLAAARLSHPYEEPVVLALEGVRARGVARMGRICSWRDDASLADLAAHVDTVLGSRCRVWGDPQRPVGRIAIGNGSVGSLIPEAQASADTLLGGEVRYHDALAAAASGLAIVETGHDVSEWPLVSVLERAITEWDADIPVVAEAPSAGWWTTEGADVGR